MLNVSAGGVVSHMMNVSLGGVPEGDIYMVVYPLLTLEILLMNTLLFLTVARSPKL